MTVHYDVPGVLHALCGCTHVNVFGDRATHLFGDVTCAACRAAFERIGEAYQAARRSNGAPARERARSPGRLVEELGEDGQWQLFDLRGWCREPEGEYTVTLRVRVDLRRREGASR